MRTRSTTQIERFLDALYVSMDWWEGGLTLMPRLPGRNQSESFPNETLRDLRTTRKHLSENFLSRVVTRKPSASRAYNCSTELH
jgi:hypothetical protein